MSKSKMQEETSTEDEKNEDVISELRELLKEDVINCLTWLCGTISAKIFEYLVMPEVERRWESNDFARDYYPWIAQILFEQEKNELKIELAFDDEATGDVIIDRNRELISVEIIQELLSQNRKPREILVEYQNLVAYITWIREAERGYRSYPQIDRLVKHLLDKSPKICPVCERAFVAQRGDKIYCSEKCAQVGQKRRQRARKKS